QEVQMTFVRDGKRSELRVRPVEWIEDGPAGAAPVAALWLGMEVASLDGGDPRVARLKDALGVTATTGVMVVAVQEDQPAANAGIRPGDVIFSLADQEIMDLDSYTQVRTQLASSREPLLVRLRTGGLENSVMIQPRSRGVEN
ncbi:MAG: PDZ domain-containing protein, partial [Candidatus Krumholzibacteria bacterium]|nr:PDZ domain-containing protein [Candidatus Krumholzibacteria bacterium]